MSNQANERTQWPASLLIKMELLHPKDLAAWACTAAAATTANSKS